MDGTLKGTLLWLNALLPLSSAEAYMEFLMREK
jgi:hypothetical protein